MEIVPISTDLELLELLKRYELPISDIASSGSIQFYGYRDNGKLSGVVGLEAYGTVALLRSLAVCSEQRNSGLGRWLVHFAERMASKMGVKSMFLLTLSAGSYFERLGYEPLKRESAPESVRKTAQFSGLCPATSSFMGKRL